MGYATIGSISHGTLRDEDLLEAFADELEYQVQRNGKQPATENQRYVDLVWEARELCDEDGNFSDPEDKAPELICELQDALNEFAAPYCYFGAHEGDGSDFGFWPSIDVLDDDARDGEVLKVEDTSEVPDDYDGTVMHVNDHGNVTLYSAAQGKLSELWACV